jgi:CubicO group peptidase (beta-lactamase class C family)
MTGRVRQGFERVERAFRDLYSDPVKAGGGALAVHVDGELVIDLWDGEARPGQAWDGSTLCPLWSVGKGLAAIVVARLAGQGVLDLDRPITDLWPELVAGQTGAPLATVLDHSLGLPCVNGYEDVVTLDDSAGWHNRAGIVQMLADSPPLWPPGNAHGYHSVTMGWLVAELVRRATGTVRVSPLQLIVALHPGPRVSVHLPSGSEDRDAIERLAADAP